MCMYLWRSRFGGGGGLSFLLCQFHRSRWACSQYVLVRGVHHPTGLDMQRAMKREGVISCNSRGGGPTFRLRKLALFNAGLEGLVEHGVKLRLRGELNLIVGFDVFLDRLATMEGLSELAKC
jgi:hypothetical protein